MDTSLMGAIVLSAFVVGNSAASELAGDTLTAPSAIESEAGEVQDTGLPMDADAEDFVYTDTEAEDTGDPLDADAVPLNH